MWRMLATFSRWNEKAHALLEEDGRPYVLLPWPSVEMPLVAHGHSEYFPRGCNLNAAALQDGYAEWETSCQIIDADALRALVTGEIEEYYSLPDRDDLLSCKRFAEIAQTTVVMYGAETFGGVPEFEWAWHFGGGEDRVFILLPRSLRTAEEQSVKTAWRRRLWRAESKAPVTSRGRLVILEVTRRGVIEHPSADGVFSHSARHLGFEAPRGYFMPFTRKFPFEKYVITPRPRKSGE